MDRVFMSDTKIDIDTFISRIDRPKCRWIFSDPEKIRSMVENNLEKLVNIEFTDGISI